MNVETDVSNSGTHDVDRGEIDRSVDGDWYLRRYPDVAMAGLDPADHYRAYGCNEGRFANAAVEMAEKAEDVDPVWYRARYPDVATTGTDPFEHYRLHGRHEGRYPNADREPREVWRTRFDPIWYRARNTDLGAFVHDPLEHFLRIGLLEGRAANASEENREAWRGTFDADWYSQHNPDVAWRGLDPLEHFITIGLLDRRRPNADVVLEAADVTAARIDRLKGGDFADEIALFVTHTVDGSIKPHVAHHVACLERCGVQCALIAACDQADAKVTGEAAALAAHVFRRANAGFDFAAWAHVLRRHPEIREAKIVYLMNDSVFGPTASTALGRVVARVRASEADLVGLTDNPDRGWHVQSYFLALKQCFVASQAGRAFFDGVVSYTHKNDVVNEYETQLARYALRHGFRVEVLFPTPDWLDATLHNWKKLLRAGFPYLKVATARGLVRGVETADWREEMIARGYDTSAADRTLAQLARERRDGAIVVDGDPDDDGAALAALHMFLAEQASLDLRAGQTPQVSFLLVLDGRPEQALRMIRALATGERVWMEFVIVDNASTDDTHHVLNRLPGATIVMNVAPLPTLRAARQAVARARAEVVVLLRPGRGSGRAGDAGASAAAGVAHRSDDAIRMALEGLSADDDGVVYEACSPADTRALQIFEVSRRGERLGTAYAMPRRDAPEALAGIVDLLDPSQAGGASDRNVL